MPIIWICLILVLFLVGIRLLLPRFVFFPSSKIETAPSALNLPFEDISLTTEDNLQIHGWFIRGGHDHFEWSCEINFSGVAECFIPPPDSRATLLFFHGNGGNISHRLSSIKIFHDLGLDVFILSYRGYGQSEGRPSIKGTGLDALAAWRWLTEERQIPAEKIVVFGRSLGGAVAMELVKSVNPGALILESTFSSLADMSPFPSSIAPFLLGGNYWNSVKTAASLSVPTLVIHSPDDDVVPFRQGRRIYEAIASENISCEKTFLEIRGNHNTGFMQSIDIYYPALDNFLTKHGF